MNINKKYYATFGQQSLFKNFYIEIISPSYEMSLRMQCLTSKTYQ